MPVSTSAQTHPRRPGNSEARHRSRLRHPGVLFAAAIAIFCAAYVLGYLPQDGGRIGAYVGSAFDSPSGSFFDAVVHISPSAEGSSAINPTVYSIGGFIAFLVLLGLMRSFDLLLRSLRGKTPLAARQPGSIEEFILECGREGGFPAQTTIGARVAREGHHLLEPYYPRPKCVELRDDLRRDLGLTAENIVALRFALLTRCDRRDPPEFEPAFDGNLGLDPAAITTVYDLLRYVEDAPSQRAAFPGLPAMRFDSRPVKTRTPEDPHAQSESRACPPESPVLEQRSADPAASAARPAEYPYPAALASTPPELRYSALLEIHAVSMTQDARTRLRPHFSGLRRRSGEHRLAAEYAGPFRRATDRPRTAVTERAAAPMPEPIAAPDDHNQMDGLLVSARNKRNSAPEQA
jgi:hypothetical protein